MKKTAWLLLLALLAGLSVFSGCGTDTPTQMPAQKIDTVNWYGVDDDGFITLYNDGSIVCNSFDGEIARGSWQLTNGGNAVELIRQDSASMFFTIKYAFTDLLILSLDESPDSLFLFTTDESKVVYSYTDYKDELSSALNGAVPVSEPLLSEGRAVQSSQDASAIDQEPHPQYNNLDPDETEYQYNSNGTIAQIDYSWDDGFQMVDTFEYYADGSLLSITIESSDNTVITREYANDGTLVRLCLDFYFGYSHYYYDSDGDCYKLVTDDFELNFSNAEIELEPGHNMHLTYVNREELALSYANQ